MQLPWSMSESKLLNLTNFIKLSQKKRIDFFAVALPCLLNILHIVSNICIGIPLN